MARPGDGTPNWSILALALVAGACSELRPVDTAVGAVEVPVLPTLEITAPARGSFHASTVRVEGTVSAGTGTLASLVVDESSVGWDARGAFESTLSPAPGLVLLGARLEDDLGERAVDGRAVQVGPTHAPGAMLTEVIGIQIGQALLDDDDDDLDDLAGITQAILTDASFGDALVGVELPGSYPINYLIVDALSIQGAEVEIRSWDGMLWLDLYLHDVAIDFTANVIGNSTVVGWATVQTATLQMDLSLDTAARGVVVDVEGVWVDLAGFAWGASALPEWIAKALADTVAEKIEESLEEQVQERVAGLIGDTLGAFALDTTFGDRDALGVKMEIARAEVWDEGLVLWMDASMRAIIPEFTPPPGAGSLATPGAPPTLPMNTSSPLVVVADDDFIDQVLFAFWLGGSLGGWDLDGAALTAMTGNPLPPPLGPVKRARMDMRLPPVVSAPQGEMDLDLGIGELHLQITREDDAVIEVSLNARAGADLTLGDGGISVQLDDRPAQMTIHAGMVRWPEALDPGDLSSLFRLSTPPLLGRSTSLFPAFPSPDIPVGAFVDLPAVGDLVWGMTDASVTVEPSGWVVLQGRMEPR